MLAAPEVAPRAVQVLEDLAPPRERGGRSMRTLRRLLCRLGIHRWQILYEPPHIVTTGQYRKAVFCIHCSQEAPWAPGEFRE